MGGMGGMGGVAVRERQDVWNLSTADPWHPTIAWYEYAFHVLRDTTDISDPRSLIAIANIHGTDIDPANWPAGVGAQTWNACQHGSWYFLPWHRMYLHFYEMILKEIIDAASGPSDWALPFWNYDANVPATLALPPAFLQPTTPQGGDNALYVTARSASILQGNGVPADDVELTGWPDGFASNDFVTPSFGGPVTGWSHFGNANGYLEVEPHGMVHVDVGGWMGRFETAGQDPIFWLHHANIDRLWEVWRNIPGHGDAQDPAWQQAGFDIGFGAALRSYLVTDILDTSANPLLYTYEGVPVHVPPAGGGLMQPDGGFALGEEEQPARPAPQLVGASDAPVPIGADPADVSIGVEAPAGGLGLDEAAVPERVYLVLQNVRGTRLQQRTFTVHVGLEPGADPSEHPDLRAGKFSTFGVVESSSDSGGESGAGVTITFDISEIVRILEAQGAWDPATLRVTVTPDPPTDPGPLGLDDESDLAIGQIGVFYG
jgi:tyrosinase